MPIEGEGASAGRLAWPPLAEDLKRLYLGQGLSASKIAKVYGLNYASEKTAESTILYHLKKNGIARRDAAAHVRKVTETMVEDWIVRYQKGESLKQIAGEQVNPVTVYNHLHKRGLELRDKVEAQIEAVSKFEKRPFSGDKHEMAYIAGLAIGDFASTRHGRAVRVRLGTTHPAMARLFRSLFETHGPIYEYPHQSPLGFEWSLDCDLDGSFDFLMDMKRAASLALADEEVFLDFLAGFFDAEGSIYYHRKGTYGAFELSLANTNMELLRELAEKLRTRGFPCRVRKLRMDQEKMVARGIKNPSEAIWKLDIWRYDTVQQLLGMLPFRHEEKVEKAKIAKRLELRPNGAMRGLVLREWHALIARIDLDCRNYITRARDAWEAKIEHSSRG